MGTILYQILLKSKVAGASPQTPLRKLMMHPKTLVEKASRLRWLKFSSPGFGAQFNWTPPAKKSQLRP